MPYWCTGKNSQSTEIVQTLHFCSFKKIKNQAQSFLRSLSYSGLIKTSTLIWLLDGKNWSKTKKKTRIKTRNPPIKYESMIQKSMKHI